MKNTKTLTKLDKELELLKKGIKKITSTKASAYNALLSAGIITKSGVLSKRYGG